MALPSPYTISTVTRTATVTSLSVVRVPIMRPIDMSTMELVHSGREWSYDVSPCSKVAISLLERNEAVVTWVKPLGVRPSL